MYVQKSYHVYVFFAAVTLPSITAGIPRFYISYLLADGLGNNYCILGFDERHSAVGPIYLV